MNDLADIVVTDMYMYMYMYTQIQSKYSNPAAHVPRVNKRHALLNISNHFMSQNFAILGSRINLYTNTEFMSKEGCLFLGQALLNLSDATRLAYIIKQLIATVLGA
jgi:hypothetical protein